MKRPVVFYFKFKEIFRIEIEYKVGEDPIKELMNFFKGIDKEVANNWLKDAYGVSFKFKEEEP